MADLSGKHALVTGGGTGVGAAIALALAGAGANVTITGRRQAPLDEVAGKHANIHPTTGDVTDERSVAQMFDVANRYHGPVDIVIANAGAAESAPLSKTSLELWEQMLAVNLTGAFLTLREGLNTMNGRDWGRLIAISSTAGLKGYAYVGAYSAAKHGVIGLVRSLALETARSGVTVNALCPGFTETPLLSASVSNIMEKTGMSEDKARASLAAGNPTGRFVQPEEVAAAVLWLCGEGSGSVSGQSISISGGETW